LSQSRRQRTKKIPSATAMYSRVLLLSMGIAACDAFAPVPSATAIKGLNSLGTSKLPLANADSRCPASTVCSTTMQAQSRRDAIVIAGAALLGLAAPPSSATAAATSASSTASVNSAAGPAAAVGGPALSGPVAVIGVGGDARIGGNLGSQIVASLASKEVDVRPVYRTPRELPVEAKGGKVASVIADITDPKTLDQAVKGAGAVVVSVSPDRYSTETRDGTESEVGSVSKGDTPMQVYGSGLANVARACVKHSVPRLIIISRSGCTEKSEGEVCGAELVGEEAVRDIYRQARRDLGNSSKLTYTIARAGTLISGMRRGAATVNLNQGDTLSGHISRPDMADLVTDMLAGGKGQMSTFEVYYKDTANPTNFMKSLGECMDTGRSMKQCAFGDSFTELPNLSEVMAGKVAVPEFNLDMNIKTVVKGDSWQAMLSSLKEDVEIDMDITEFGVQNG